MLKWRKIEDGWKSGPLAVKQNGIAFKRYDVIHVKTGLACCLSLKKSGDAKKLADIIVQEFRELISMDEPGNGNRSEIRKLKARIVEFRRSIGE